MDNNQIVSKMNEYLHSAAELLVKWLGKVLPKVEEDWWNTCVLDNLTYNQRQIALDKGFSKLEEFDLAALLKIANRSWFVLRQYEYLPNNERETIRDMIRVRNNWAHCSATLPGKDVIMADLETLTKFFGERGGSHSVVADIEKMTEEMKASSAKVFDSITKPTVATPEKDGEDLKKSATGTEEIKIMDTVYLVADPSVVGMVAGVTDIGDQKKYQVFVEGSVKTFYTGQIALVKQEESYHWMDTKTFSSYLTAYQINNPSNRDLYSLNSARIDFVPYQFRPALKLIHADEPRILIADSVGVGKTIEAGLIIKELEARNDLNNILIVCPKPLVTERKWELEMKRFDEDFTSLTGPELRQVLSDTNRDGAWPDRYSKVIVPYSILDSRTYEGTKSGRKRFYGLTDLDPAPHFDLVIIDEAHHIRNGSIEKQKAYEYKCVKYFCDHADAVVMLTATPLQTGDDDLYTLLNVLRPDIVIDKEIFDLMSKPNAWISQSVSALRRAGEGWQENALDALKKVLDTQWGENVIAKNPTYARIIQTLQKKDITREERVKLISDTESLHSFNSMINRTRRKDIQDFCVRKSYTLAVGFTEAQEALHSELLDFERAALTLLHGSGQSISFMMTTIKRQAASCIFGLAPHIRDLIQRRFSQLDEYIDIDTEGVKLEGIDTTALEPLAQKLLKMADQLPDEDPKFDSMLEVIAKKQTFTNNKIMIFSTFRYTLRYLRMKLEKSGYRIGQIDGRVKDEDRRDLRTRFEKPKEDNDAIDIMLFTEVGSEGLDYQFCDMMINYDLPWNPMMIEQRIGRIDRRGQKSEVVNIYNMITNGTVDAEIYYRCLLRIGVFERSIGECDQILGEIATEIDQIAMDSKLSEEDRQIKLEQIADNQVRKVQELEKLEDEEKELFGFDLSEYTTAEEIHKAENPWLSPRNLENMIVKYLNDRLGEKNYFVGEGTVRKINLSHVARTELRKDFNSLGGKNNAVGQAWDFYLKGTSPWHSITFDSEVAERDRDAFFITPMHPLAKQAAAYYASAETSYIHLRYASDEIPEGTWRFSVYAWSYKGLNPHFRMIVSCENESVEKELSDILQDAQSVEPGVSMKPEDWDSLESRQMKYLMVEKKKEIQDASTVSAAKVESLTNNFRNRKRSLERKYQMTDVESLHRMYLSQMDSAENYCNQKIQEIKEKASRTDILSTLIANGILDVVR